MKALKFNGGRPIAWPAGAYSWFGSTMDGLISGNVARGKFGLRPGPRAQMDFRESPSPQRCDTSHSEEIRDIHEVSTEAATSHYGRAMDGASSAAARGEGAYSTR